MARMRPLGLVLLATALPAAEAPPPVLGAGDAAGDARVLWLYGGTTAAVTAYGLVFWDWGGRAFHTTAEGWFDRDTRYGGADKLGHGFTAYLFANGFAWAQEQWGYDQETAAWMGAAGGLAIQTLIEIGDGFADEYGFAWEDQVFNTVGAGLAWLRRRSPLVRRSLDWRLEYWPSPAMRSGESEVGDAVTDYSGMKYVLALRPAGFLDLPAWMGPLELQAGYFTRGFASGEERWWEEPERTGYVAIGLDLTTLLGSVTRSPARHVFDYYQVPYTYLPMDRDW